jgi:hypothetical protein
MIITAAGNFSNNETDNRSDHERKRKDSMIDEVKPQTEEALTTRERILARAKCKTETIEVEGLGAIRLRQLSTGKSVKLRRVADKEEFSALLFIESVVDENDNALFTEADIPEINELPMAAVTQIIRAISELNQFTAQPTKA